MADSIFVRHLINPREDRDLIVLKLFQALAQNGFRIDNPGERDNLHLYIPQGLGKGFFKTFESLNELMNEVPLHNKMGLMVRNVEGDFSFDIMIVWDCNDIRKHSPFDYQNEGYNAHIISMSMAYRDFKSKRSNVALVEKMNRDLFPEVNSIKLIASVFDRSSFAGYFKDKRAIDEIIKETSGEIVFLPGGWFFILRPEEYGGEKILFENMKHFYSLWPSSVMSEYNRNNSRPLQIEHLNDGSIFILLTELIGR